MLDVPLLAFEGAFEGATKNQQIATKSQQIATNRNKETTNRNKSQQIATKPQPRTAPELTKGMIAKKHMTKINVSCPFPSSAKWRAHLRRASNVRL
jgi:hypothetical protein